MGIPRRMNMKYKKIGCIGRWKPLHLGGAVLLESLCEASERVIIGIGSVNRYNIRNPFTPEETEDMIRNYLAAYDNYTIVHVKDSLHIPNNKKHDQWIWDMRSAFEELDAFVSGNPYVTDLLKDIYNIIPSKEFVKTERYDDINATKIRYLMAQGDEWKKLVPKTTEDYLVNNQLDKRFREEFGQEVLKSGNDGTAPQSLIDEKNNILKK
jgi:nicotinamide mononucleotide adenylyltransferase